MDKITFDINVLEKERSRIAADLHDDLGGVIASVKLMLLGIRLKQPSTSKLTMEAEGQIDEIMSKLRAISYNLAPLVLERKGLTAAVEELVCKLGAQSGIVIDHMIDVHGDKTGREIHIFRIIQEILNNTVKHSKANKVKLILRTERDKLKLSIADNGVGFNKEDVARRASGTGLHNIISRVDILKAKIVLTSEIGKGVSYLIEIPNQ